MDEDSYIHQPKDHPVFAQPETSELWEIAAALWTTFFALYGGFSELLAAGLSRARRFSARRWLRALEVLTRRLVVIAASARVAGLAPTPLAAPKREPEPPTIPPEPPAEEPAARSAPEPPPPLDPANRAAWSARFDPLPARRDASIEVQVQPRDAARRRPAGATSLRRLLLRLEALRRVLADPTEAVARCAQRLRDALAAGAYLHAGEDPTTVDLKEFVGHTLGRARTLLVDALAGLPVFASDSG